jgi:hypothetical protein
MIAEGSIHSNAAFAITGILRLKNSKTWNLIENCKSNILCRQTQNNIKM